MTEELQELADKLQRGVGLDSVEVIKGLPLGLTENAIESLR